MAENLKNGDKYMSEVICLKEQVEYSEGSVVSKTLMKKAAGTVTLFAFDAGQGLSTHSAPFEAIVQVVDGKGSFNIGGTDYKVNEGEMLIMPAGVPHSVIAKERFKMMLTMIKS